MSSYPELGWPRLLWMVAVLFLSAPKLQAQVAAPTSNTGTDALQMQVWQGLQAGDERRLSEVARRLLAIDPDNSLALSALVTSEQDNRVLSVAKRGLRNADRLRCPEKMSERECAQMRTEVLARLNAAAGRAYLAREDHITARRYLNNAIALAPAHPQYVYAAALANLEGKNPRPDVGYRLLARAVHLTEGLPGGREIEEFARQRYISEGGSSEDWDAHLAAARPQGSAPAAASSTPRPDGDTTSGSAPAEVNAAESEEEPTVSVEIGPAIAEAPSEAENGQEDNASARVDRDTPIPRTADRSPQSAEPQPEEQAAERELEPPVPPRGTEMAKNTPPKSFPELAQPMPDIEPGTPVSLGIVIQSSLGGQTKAIARALSSLVRQLREEDEAFVISFNNGLVFEQDFTGNYRLLEQALEGVEPQPGTALMESVGFAAVHLARVGKNQERVLLLISDGRDAAAQEADPKVIENIEASGARIFCIGVAVEADRRDRLARLASGTGGAAVFISGGSQFYAAADRLAEALRIREKVEGMHR